MEKTELREQFFAEVRSDPYAHMLTRHVTEMWAEGYEQALRDHGLDEQRVRESHRDRVDRAVEWLTEDRRRRDVESIIALSQLGVSLDELKRLRGE
jgi:hypothetical protein